MSLARRRNLIVDNNLGLTKTKVNKAVNRHIFTKVNSLSYSDKLHTICKTVQRES